MKRLNKFISSLSLYFLIFFLGFPMIILLIWGFTSRWPWPHIFPKDFSLKGFNYILGASSLEVILTSIILSIVVTLITIIISIPASKALALYEFKGKRLFKILVLAPLIIPPAAISMGIHIVFMKIGLANTFCGVILIHMIFCIPYGITIFANIFEIIGNAMEMQGKVLGASPIQVFLNITLPLISPGIVSAGSIIFIVSFSQYFITFLIGGGKVITLSMIMFPYIQSGDRNLASLYSIIFITINLILIKIMEKSVKSYYNTKNHFYI